MKFISPYLAEGRWLRGSLHTHTTVSDGEYSPADTVRAYKERARYDFIAITDHAGVHAKKELYEKPASTGDFCVIEGREDSCGRHILGIGCPMTFGEDPIGKEAGEYLDADNQRVVDRIVEQGGLAYLAHPHWLLPDYWAAERVAALNGVAGLEIINGDRFAPVSNLATDVWDRALTAGKTLWGIGADDFHGPDTFFNAWTMVFARSNTREDILDALSRGSCYASNGASFKSLAADGAWIIAECGDDSFYADCEKTFRFIGGGGKLLQTQMGSGAAAAYRAAGDEQYVRVELSLSWGCSAFSQPFFLR